MASFLTVTCDVCGQPVTTDRVLLKVASGPLRRRTHEIDLGPCCLPGLEALLNGQPAGLIVEALRGDANGQAQASEFPTPEQRASRASKHPAALTEPRPDTPATRPKRQSKPK